MPVPSKLLETASAAEDPLRTLLAELITDFLSEVTAKVGANRINGVRSGECTGMDTATAAGTGAWER